MYINRDEPDPEILPMLGRAIPHVSYVNHYVVDNLHHDVYNIYF